MCYSKASADSGKMCIIATFMKRAPANVEPIAWSRGFCLNVLDLMGRVPTPTTIKKNRSITRDLSNARIRLLSILISDRFIIWDYYMVIEYSISYTIIFVIIGWVTHLTGPSTRNSCSSVSTMKSTFDRSNPSIMWRRSNSHFPLTGWKS